MRIVVALGGNALIERGGPTDIASQARTVARAAASVAALAQGNELIVTHGNGPQIGLLALAGTSPLDVLGAETEGMIGYLLERELANRLGGSRIATVLTQTEVDASDPAFSEPTKFIGPVYDMEQAQRLAREHSWHIARDGTHWRRVVPSPAPRAILELAAIRCLVSGGFLVICAGGGGIPVIRRDDGRLAGIDGVVDKDSSSALLAESIDADCLLMLTDVDAVRRDWGTPLAQRIRDAHPDAIGALPFAAGSMGPKVAAACRFGRDGRRAYIGALDDGVQILAGKSGTRISDDLSGLTYYEAAQQKRS